MLVSSFFFNCNALHAWVWLVLPIQLPSFYSSSSSCCVCLPGREPDGSDVAGFSRGTCVCYIWLVLVCVHLKLLTSVPLPVLLTYSWKAVNSLWWSFSTSNPVIWMQMSVKTPTLKNLTLLPRPVHSTPTSSSKSQQHLKEILSLISIIAGGLVTKDQLQNHHHSFELVK